MLKLKKVLALFLVLSMCMSFMILPVTAEAAEAWKPVTEGVLHSPWLRQQLCTAGEVLFCRAGDCLQLAVPFDSNRPFPMPSLFCFARIRQIRGREYAIFAFDRENWPVFIE